MTKREELEEAIEAAVEAGAYDAADAAIEVLDAVDSEPDLEDDDDEHEVGEPEDMPPLMDGGFGYSLGRLPIYDSCPCCGHLELECYASPVIQGFDSDAPRVL